MTNYKATIGTVSHGTMRNADLICAFADELRNFDADNKFVKESDAVQTLWAAGWNDIYDHEMCSDLVQELFHVLPALFLWRQS